MKWTENEINTIVDLFKSGKSYFQVACSVGRTEASVKQKLNRMGYKCNIREKPKKYCANCEKEITSKDGKKFCSKSCSASFNNRHRPQSQPKPQEKDKNLPPAKKQCLSCGKENVGYAKYCNNQCQADYRRKKIFQKIEEGDTSLNTRQYKAYLINLYGEKCMECGWCETNPASGKIPIDLEHIDGDSTNNSLDNLKLLCPNCHSLTPTYKSLNKGKGRAARRQRYRDGKSY